MDIGSEVEPRGERLILVYLDTALVVEREDGSCRVLEIVTQVVKVIADAEHVVRPWRDHAVPGETADKRGLDGVGISIGDGCLGIDADALAGVIRQFIEKMRSTNGDVVGALFVAGLEPRWEQYFGNIHSRLGALGAGDVQAAGPPGDFSSPGAAE